MNQVVVYSNTTRIQNTWKVIASNPNTLLTEHIRFLSLAIVKSLCFFKKTVFKNKNKKKQLCNVLAEFHIEVQQKWMLYTIYLTTYYDSTCISEQRKGNRRPKKSKHCNSSYSFLLLLHHQPYKVDSSHIHLL